MFTGLLRAKTFQYPIVTECTLYFGRMPNMLGTYHNLYKDININVSLICIPELRDVRRSGSLARYPKAAEFDPQRFTDGIQDLHLQRTE